MKWRGFTLIELLVVVAIIALLVAILLPALGQAREMSYRSACGANLHGIMGAMNIYGAENGTFPVIRPVPGPWAYGFYYVGSDQGTAATDPELAINDIIATGNGGYGLNQSSVSGGWWLLVLRNQISTKQFLCRSDPVASQVKPPVIINANGTYRTDFQNSGAKYSYSMAYPYNSAAARAPWGAPVGGWWKNLMDASLPIIADMAPMEGSGSNPVVETVQAAPGPANAKAWNSNNHQRVGQNVGFSDTHVEFCKRPDVGQNLDNIWTHNGSSGPVQYGGTAVDVNAPSAQQLTPGYGCTNPPWDIVMVPVRNVSTGVTK